MGCFGSRLTLPQRSEGSAYYGYNPNSQRDVVQSPNTRPGKHDSAGAPSEPASSSPGPSISSSSIMVDNSIQGSSFFSSEKSSCYSSREGDHMDRKSPHESKPDCSERQGLGGKQGNHYSTMNADIDQGVGDRVSNDLGGAGETEVRELQERGGERTVVKIEHFSLKDVKEATGRFKTANIIGEGGFGWVYKGELALKSGTEKVEGRQGLNMAFREKKKLTMPVAVKRMKPDSAFGYEAFLEEVLALSSLSHPNILQLRGICNEKCEAIIIYEFMPKGNLAEALENNVSWQVRIKVAKDIANGLLYLHENRFIHRDLKATNILLDQDFSAKISDLGLIKSCGKESFRSLVLTRVLGTRGYIDPSYYETGELHTSSDVYSFGVILLGLITGKLPGSHTVPENYVKNLSAFLESPTKTCRDYVDPRLGQDYERDQVARLAIIAKSCLQLDRISRPSMIDISKWFKTYL